MSITDTLFNNVTVTSSSGSSGSTASTAAVPGSGSNNAIQVIGGNPLDTAFLDALYAGGKLTPTQRDAILTGSDPSTFGLSQYDLYYLTVGRLGSKSSSCCAMPLITAFALSVPYQQGQLVTYQPAGAPGLGVYQATTSVPAGTVPPNPAYWLTVVSPTAPIIPLYSATTAYPRGALVLWQAPGTQSVVLYQAAVDAPAGSLPSNGQYWLALQAQSPTVLYDADVLNPALSAASAAGANILTLQKTNGSALPTFTVPAGRGYKVIVQEPRPANRGQSLATDHALRLVAFSAEQQASDGVSWSVTITPGWFQTAFANNAAIAAVAANAVAVRVRVELI